MKINIKTSNPNALKNAIFSKANDGKLETWAIRKGINNNQYLTHTPDQWEDKALIEIASFNERLDITVNRWEGRSKPTAQEEGICIGRFVEVLLNHFQDYFDNILIIK